jgi:hypothetical protein
MSNEYSIPPLRDLPPGRLELRKEHLLAEIAQARHRRYSSPTLSFGRVRLAAIAAGACAVAGTVVLGIALTGGSGARAGGPFLVQAVHGPSWGAYTGTGNWAGGSSATCTAAAQVLFGCGGILAWPNTQGLEAVGAPASKEPSQPTETTGGTPEEQRLLRSIVASMEPNAVTRIELVSSSRAVTLRMEADSSMRTLWQEALIAGAFRDRSSLAGNDLEVSLEDGESSGAITPGPSELPAARPGDTAKARQTFERTAQRSGANLDDLTIYRPDGVAVAVTLSTAHPASFLVEHMPGFLAGVGDRWHDYDGVYIRLVDGSGRTVWETSTAARTSAGAVGSLSELAGCSPIANWGPTPPACPVS